jgi:predicted RNA-binding protein with PIN domain
MGRMLYLVDGYNVTMADDATRRLARERQREALVRRLAIRGEDLLGDGRTVVVFDGQHGSTSPATRAGLEVRFSHGESADDVIVRIAESAAGAVTLVSSDRELRARVSAVASPVTVRGCSSLFDERMARAPRRKGRGRFPAATAGLPEGANKITEELKAVWLEDEETG